MKRWKVIKKHSKNPENSRDYYMDYQKACVHWYGGKYGAKDSFEKELISIENKD